MGRWDGEVMWEGGVGRWGGKVIHDIVVGHFGSNLSLVGVRISYFRMSLIAYEQTQNVG